MGVSVGAIGGSVTMLTVGLVVVGDGTVAMDVGALLNRSGTVAEGAWLSAKVGPEVEGTVVPSVEGETVGPTPVNDGATLGENVGPAVGFAVGLAVGPDATGLEEEEEDAGLVVGGVKPLRNQIWTKLLYKKVNSVSLTSSPISSVVV